MLLIADVGTNFGMRVANIFDPWKPSVLVRPTLEVLRQRIGDIDLICFGGGEDISPGLYGHKLVGSHSEQTPSYRDLFEKEAWKIAVSANKPILGICRGAQLACVLSGGGLIQDVRGHGPARSGDHVLDTIDGGLIPFNSYHHQMMVPGGTKHKLLAWLTVPPVTADTGPNRAYQMDSTKVKLPNPFNKEPEIVYFTESKALAIQGHPEFYNDPMEEPVVYTRSLVNRYLGLAP